MVQRADKCINFVIGSLQTKMSERHKYFKTKSILFFLEMHAFEIVGGCTEESAPRQMKKRQSYSSKL